MTTDSTRPAHRRLSALIAVMALALCAAFSTGSAAAAPANGTAVLELQPGKATTDLLAQGVHLSYKAKQGKTGSAKRKAAADTLRLPIDSIAFGKVIELGVEGNLVFAHGKRKVTVRAIDLRVGAKQTSLVGRVGKRSIVVFRAEGESHPVANSVGLSKAPFALTGQVADALAPRLGLDSIEPGQLGRLSLTALQDDLPKEEPKPTEPVKIDDGGLLPPDPYPYSAQCPVKKVEGPAIGEVPGQVAGIDPAPLFDAGSSQPVTGTAIEWGFLQSFRNYVLNMGPGSLQTLDGASASASGAAMAGANEFFSFPVDDGTYEPGVAPNHSDDKLVAGGTGTVLFCKSGHGFNVVLKNPTVTIDGANSRITADVGVNQHGTWYPFQRVDIADLNLSAVQPTVSAGGNTLVWDDIPATLSADGAKATGLGDQYPAGEVLDTITVKTSLDRPLLAQCGVAAGTVPSPPTVNFALAALPSLTTPVTRSGKNLGTINWGFRRSTRNTIAGGGTFPLSGGATESFPGSMGGGNSLPPGGGLGKFFRFPISSYSYEAGTGDPTDDRLIASSNATVGFCKPNSAQGNFGLIISKPTLVIDGANSRIVANAYSFSGPFMSSPALGWIGGRVELVKLNTVGFSTTTGVGTVKWGEVNPDFEPLQNGIQVSGALQTEALSLANLTVASTGAGGFDPVAAQIVLP